MSQRKNLADVIADARRARDLTQAELSSCLGVSGQMVSRWERGVARPGRANLKALATTLGLDVAELLDLSLEAQHEDLVATRKDRDQLIALIQSIGDRFEAVAERLEDLETRVARVRVLYGTDEQTVNAFMVLNAPAGPEPPRSGPEPPRTGGPEQPPRNEKPNSRTRRRPS